MECFVGLTKSRVRFAVLSTILSFFQKGVSHAAFFLYLRSTKKWYVIDSTRHGGIKIHAMEKFAAHHVLVRKYPLSSTEEQKKQVMQWAVERSYQEYPVIEIVGNGLQIIVSLLSLGKLKIPNIFGQGKHYPRCNEAISLILMEIYNLKITEDLDSTDLVWLENFLQKELAQ